MSLESESDSSGKRRCDRRRRRVFMGGIGVGVQEHDREAPHARRAPAPRSRRSSAVAIERGDDLAVRRHPLHHLAPPPARHQRRRHLDREVVQLVFAFAADLRNVGEAGGGQQPGGGALALDQRVGEQRRRVHDAADLAGGDGALGEQVPDARQRALRGIVRRGALLPDHGGAVAMIERDQVGERAADVDPERDGRRAFLSPAPQPAIANPACTSRARWQATKWSWASAPNCGISLPTAGDRHRAACVEAATCGGCAGSGGSPSSTMRLRPRSRTGSGIGEADSSARV